MFRGAKRRAKAHRLPFRITLDDIVIPARCPALHIPLRVNRGGKAQSDYSPTLDRIINGKGYVPGNVIVISALANRIKNNATIEQLLAVANYYSYMLKGREGD